MKLPHLDAAAKAQTWGLLVSFALSLLAARRIELGLGAYIVGIGLTWAAWEFTGGRWAATHKHAVPLALASGLAIPWGGFVLAWALMALRP